ncbi:MAG: CBS domain-containing protein [bacterium]|nr:CBS domain-containing protein [bacterium]
MPVVPSLSAAMTPFPYSIEIDERVSSARAMMTEHDMRHLPVTDEGKLVGVITDRDIGLAVGPSPIPEAEDLAIRALSVLDAYSIDIATPLRDVLLDMADRHIGSALVTKRGKLAGIFTATDACRCFGEYLNAQSPRNNDAA